MKRPVGVTILAVIAVIYGIFSLLLALLGLLGSALLASGVAAVVIRYSAGTWPTRRSRMPSLAPCTSPSALAPSG
jgi:hypothetical protein